MTPIEEEKLKIQKLIDKKISAFEKALEKAKKSLEESHRFDEARHVAELVKSHYGVLKKGMTELKVLDWAKENQERLIALDPKYSPKEALEKLFKKSKKLERAIGPLTLHIAKIAQEHERLQILKTALDSAETIDALEAIK